MNNTTLNEQAQPSAFALIVDHLRTKSEAELKMLYLQFFKTKLSEEWKKITTSSNFNDAFEEDIVQAIQKNRNISPV